MSWKVEDNTRPTCDQPRRRDRRTRSIALFYSSLRANEHAALLSSSPRVRGPQPPPLHTPTSHAHPPTPAPHTRHGLHTPCHRLPLHTPTSYAHSPTPPPHTHGITTRKEKVLCVCGGECKEWARVFVYFKSRHNRERDCFVGGRESVVHERPCLGTYSVAEREGGRKGGLRTTTALYSFP